ncbi:MULTISPECIES: LysR substrate-binding domain-containing protein [unclassified Pseudomonas]|uniref:LysR substrate-binding domain-containing protein n=1 Tax=unclassified Pseudomonas TaxID=196821 RepID=UPI000BC6A7F3|nr:MULTISPECIES: LysR substrate-binding domain-containing protein [unclassified Pseudomonas]PVZ19669.1 DNA-binding transcriptional LysR family regulator [Pseudomonas sp. URIL14HWK12:I12]PVZ22746.1 DNA-binding transcriptional LysR family regulator [Pseudomonas sp. URIL14HWK12:I10]PVZ37624.1 DNA-binding transcriptional LysR family regulator [Pseudomonas sp. URIL14HWK12:I11]SNZ15278.1 DNA-binding transcriptional regulator, LysR family [Pseudomonas sp. URIL14HWK12:I9]
MGFDLRYLHSFIVLAEELQFSRAAKRLCITQSALSQQIARLEGQIDVRLFDRTRRTVALSEGGQVLLAHARSIVASVENAVAHARLAQEGKVGRLTVAYVDAAPFNVLSPIVVAYRKRYPDVQLSLVEMSSGEQLEALETGRVDVGLMRPVRQPEWLRTRLVGSEAYVVAMAAGHPLAGCESIDLPQLALEPFIATSAPKARYIRSRFDPVFAKHGIEPRVVQEVNQLASMLSLVGAGLGITLLPASVVRHNTHEVAFRPLTGTMPKAEMALAWHCERENALIRRFVEVAWRAGRTAMREAGAAACAQA